ncbi:hypothetical protein J6590_065002 [Homalodisca vitripennis]|nr:hypothetical protein J6590_065002 [Homalodisca vitripennis]
MKLVVSQNLNVYVHEILWITSDRRGFKTPRVNVNQCQVSDDTALLRKAKNLTQYSQIDISGEFLCVRSPLSRHAAGAFVPRVRRTKACTLVSPTLAHKQHYQLKTCKTPPRCVSRCICVTKATIAVGDLKHWRLARFHPIGVTHCLYVTKVTLSVGDLQDSTQMCATVPTIGVTHCLYVTKVTLSVEDLQDSTQKCATTWNTPVIGVTHCLCVTKVIISVGELQNPSPKNHNY